MFLFLIFFLCVYLLTLAFLSVLNTIRAEKGIDLANKAGLSVVFAACLGWILLQVSSTQSLLNDSFFVFNWYPFILGAFALSLNAVQRRTGRRFWSVLLITVLSVAFIPQNLLVFQGILPLLLDRLITAILWAFFISAYGTMDKVVGLTFLQTNALCLSFALVPILSAKRGFLFSSELSFYPLMISVALLAFVSFKKYAPDLRLGRCGALPLGYLVGLFLILLTAKGWTWVALVMPIYYYFEIIYSRLNVLFHRANPQPKLFTFFISKVIRENLDSRKILPSLFLFMLGFAVDGILFGHSLYISFVLALLLLICIVYKLSHWGSKSVTYRSMYNDTKDMSVQIWQNLKTSINEVSSAIKKKK